MMDIKQIMNWQLSNHVCHVGYFTVIMRPTNTSEKFNIVNRYILCITTFHLLPIYSDLNKNSTKVNIHLVVTLSTYTTNKIIS